MKKQIKKIGRSTAIIFDEYDIKLYSLKEGDVLIFDIVGKEGIGTNDVTQKTKSENK